MRSTWGVLHNTPLYRTGNVTPSWRNLSSITEMSSLWIVLLAITLMNGLVAVAVGESLIVHFHFDFDFDFEFELL